MKKLFFALAIMAMTQACTNPKPQKSGNLKMMILDPGHFHAALIQKSMLPGVDSTVYVYAPKGTEVTAHAALINQYNTRPEQPTGWKMEAYYDADFLERMLAEKPGDMVVLAGNNKKKTEYIAKSVAADLHVLSDKPMAINKDGFNLLEEAFKTADKQGVILFDIMTERYNIYSILQKELIRNQAVFGTLQKGSLAEPAIIKNSVHHFYKEVSGKPLIRPAWYYDVEQEGEGIVDVTTHSIDLVQWQCFPEALLDYKKDVEVLSASRYPTRLTLAQFRQSTDEGSFPGFLHKDVHQDTLDVYANGEINYSIKGIHSKVSVQWAYQAAPGAGDTHLSQMRGTRAIVSIKQGKAEGFKPTLYIEPVNASGFSEVEAKEIAAGFAEIEKNYPGIALKKIANGYTVVIPDALQEGHEEHFAHVAHKFMDYVKAGKLPEWEKAFMLTKYFITTEALEKARTVKGGE